jgi:hypothetical protein
MLLLAQATPPAFDWERMLTVQGPLYVLFLLFVWFVVWYVPGLVSGHREMMKQVGDGSKRSADALEVLSQSHTASADHHGKTHKALKHAIRGHEALTDDSEAKAHFGQALRELE